MDSKGGEVRRLHIVYFLSRLGQVEQPHLIRVHHLTRNGVYLRDVKRWLGDIRGKEMPEAFSWSYKRRYRTGYVWQDLVDNDLITPISDNEYVLKGSEVIPQDSRSCSLDEKRVSITKEGSIEAAIEDKLQPNDENNDDPENKSETPLKASSEIIEESPPFSSGRSTITEEYDSAKLEEKSSDTIEEKPEEESETLKNQSSFYSILLRKKKIKKKKKRRESEEKDNTNTPKSSASNTSSSSSQSSFRKSNGSSSSMLRNLMGCGAAVTNDAVLVSVRRADKTASNDSDTTFKFRVGDKTGMSARVFGTCWDEPLDLQQPPQQLQRRYSARGRNCDDFGQETRKKSDQEFTSRKSVSSAYKPAGGPSCSQCGKTFRPEKLHAHMKSCRGIKCTAKTEKTPSSKPPASSSDNLLTDINISSTS